MLSTRSGPSHGTVPTHPTITTAKKTTHWAPFSSARTHLVVVHAVHGDDLRAEGGRQPRPLLRPQQPLRVGRHHHVEAEVSDLVQQLPEAVFFVVSILVFWFVFFSAERVGGGDGRAHETHGESGGGGRAAKGKTNKKKSDPKKPASASHASHFLLNRVRQGNAKNRGKS